MKEEAEILEESNKLVKLDINCCSQSQHEAELSIASNISVKCSIKESGNLRTLYFMAFIRRGVVLL